MTKLSFRMSTSGDCRDVVRCDRAGIAGTIRYILFTNNPS